MCNVIAAIQRIMHNSLICLRYATVVAIMLAGGCSKSADFNVRMYRAVDQSVVLKLVSPTQADLIDARISMREHFIGQYICEGTRLCVTINVRGAKTVSCYDVIPDGLRNERGVILYKPDNFEAALATVAGYKALAEALAATNSRERQEYYLQAKELYQKAADAGEPRAMFGLGICYHNGWGAAKDDEQAVKWLQKAADANNPKAMNELGWHYENGWGMAKDNQQARKWYQKGADAGDTVAMRNLGLCYHDGRGVTKDDHEAVKWWQKIAGTDEIAMNNLGHCYRNGWGVEKDDQQAVKWFQKSAEAGYSGAMLALGEWYHNGCGASRDDQEAIGWWRKAVILGESKGMRSLGLCYHNGWGVEKDDQQAFEWYQKGANTGDAGSMNNLGQCYYNGWGVEKDDRQAVKWYQKAVDAGEPGAKDNLRLCYFNDYKGRGVVQDRPEAAKFFAENSKVTNKLEPTYHNNNDRSVVKDDQQVFKGYQKGADADDPAAMNNLGECYRNGSGVIKDDQQAFKWYEKAANAGNVEAMDNLGWCYSHGLGVTKDYQQAVKWHQKAADAGNYLARNNLAWLLATCPRDDIRNGEKAIDMAKRACNSWPNIRRYSALDTLAAAHAEVGDFNEAITICGEAIARAEKANDQTMVAKIQSRMAVYQTHKPWRQD